MKKFSKSSILTIIVSFVFGLAGATSAFAATSPSLGAAASFAILAQTQITGVSTASGISGDVEGNNVTGGASITALTTAMVNGTIYSSTPFVTGGGATTILKNALVQANASTAYDNLNSAVYGNEDANCTKALDGAPGKDTGGQQLGGLSLPPGLYCSAADYNLTGTLTLTGTGTWVFKTVSGITTAVDSVVTGGDPCNVWWRIGSAVSTLGASSTFIGTIIAATGIHFGTNVTLTGRALAIGGDVTLSSDGTTITAPTSCTGYVVPTRRRIVTPTPIVPIIGITKIPSPLALPNGPGQVTYNYKVWNVAKLQALIDVTVVDDKCSPVVLNSGDTNNDGILDINEEWKYTCTSMVTSTTTNTAIATAHSSDGYYNTAVATAIATVAVGTSVQPPLIHIVKVPSQLTPFPFGGGNVTYTYTVTNPGIVALNNVTVTDDKCPTVSFVSGDTNGNNLLNVGESWIYTCNQNIKVSTGNVATAKGNANGLTAIAYAFANVLVAVPGLPKTGFGPEGLTISWITIVLAIAVVVLSIWLSVVLKKGKNKIKI